MVLKTRALLAALVLACFCGCSPPAPVRLAVLPFANLTQDANLNWLSAAAGAVLVFDLPGSREIRAFPVERVDGAYGQHANRVLETYFDVTGGRLHMHAALEDLDSRKIARFLNVDGPLQGGPLPLLNQLAKEIDPAAHAFGTNDQAAFGSFGQAIASPDLSTRARLLQTAIVQDPNFPAAYAQLTDTLILLQQFPQAQSVASAGLSHASDALDRARLSYALALAQSNAPGRKKALEDLARLTPADPKPWQDLGAMAVSERNFPEAVRDYSQAAKIDPSDPSAFNLLGYAEAYNGDLAAARNSLQQYQRLSPDGDLNPLDSLGEVSFYLGDFAAAERYFLEVSAGNSGIGETLKAAQARMLTGDLRGADALFNRYLSQQQDTLPVRGYRQAQWEFLTGRRKQAMSRLQALASGVQGDTAALTYSQLVVWSLQTGNRNDASRYVEQALTNAVSPGARNIAALCRFLDTTPWKSSNNAVADAYALILAGRFTDAKGPLETVYRSTQPGLDGEVRTLLAWAYEKSAQPGKARDLTRLYPIPLAQADSMFASLAFPRFLQVKAAANSDLARLGKLFEQYQGDLPDKL